MVQPIVNCQHNRRALFGGQLEQRGLNFIGIGGAGIFPARLLRGEFLGNPGLQFKSPRLALTPIQAGIDGDAVKPGGELGSTTEGANLLVGAKKRLLRESSASASEPVIRYVSECTMC